MVERRLEHPAVDNQRPRPEFVAGGELPGQLRHASIYCGRVERIQGSVAVRGKQQRPVSRQSVGEFSPLLLGRAGHRPAPRQRARLFVECIDVRVGDAGHADSAAQQHPVLETKRFTCEWAVHIVCRKRLSDSRIAPLFLAGRRIELVDMLVAGEIGGFAVQRQPGKRRRRCFTTAAGSQHQRNGCERNCLKKLHSITEQDHNPRDGTDDSAGCVVHRATHLSRRRI